ncbi:hypothetical protein IP84_16970 [beta proteobacterium AAP99]|nr:hypothetical protein IP84_16970 [beta proteobacterium AAP99]
MNYRSRRLLDLAQGKDCLLQIPNVCTNDTSTTVAAHSNELKHGKGRSIKAHDYFTVCACHACHSWLDQGPAPRAEKRDAFAAGWSRQYQEWLRLYADTTTPPKEREAIMHALKAMEAI